VNNRCSHLFHFLDVLIHFPCQEAIACARCTGL
jgi:hypothetical protein